MKGTSFDGSVTFAGDGQEALLEVAKSLPAGIVLDLNMPNLDGIATLRRIRQEYGDLPVIMFSTANDPDQILICRDLGVLAYTVKPVDFSAFRVVVARIVSQFQELANAKRESPSIVRLRK